jgi:outer membrane protein assembly factor BamB
MSQNLFIYSHGKIAALKKVDGSIVWEKALKEYGLKTMATTAGILKLEDNKLYLAVYGFLICVSAKNGDLIWKNELKGWGYNFIDICIAENDTANNNAQRIHNNASYG